MEREKRKKSYFRSSPVVWGKPMCGVVRNHNQSCQVRYCVAGLCRV